MNKYILLVLLSLCFLYSTYCYSGNMDNIYVEIDNRIMPITDAFKYRNVKLEKAERMSTFKAQGPGLECSADFSEKNNDCMARIFPNNVFVRIDFINVKPNKKIYIDNEIISNTDSKGYKSEQIIYLIPGEHRIELKNTEEVFDIAKVQIKRSSHVKCEGKNKMICSVSNLE